MTNKRIKIITDPEHFKDRVEEIVGDVSFEYVLDVVAKLKDALYADKRISALCAPQIGHNIRLFVVRNGKKDESRFKVILNPMLVSGKGLHLSREINASFPQKEFIIPRRDEIHLAYQTSDGHVTSETFIGAYAEIVQQMTEMLDGITVADYGLDLDAVGGSAAFDKASNKEKVALLSMYMENLTKFKKDLDTEIEGTPALKEINDAIDFGKEVLLGNIKPIVEKDAPEEPTE